MKNIQHWPLAIDGLHLIEPIRHEDVRGTFCEVWNADLFSALGIPKSFVQDNHTLSLRRQTIRGLHMQVGPFSQGKLVRVLRGAIWDVVVDVRVNSPTFGQHIAVELSSENWLQLWIPAGFLHGYCTLQDETEVMYKVTKPYAPQAELGVNWKDDELKIPWPLSGGPMTVSDRDAKLPRFSEAMNVLGKLSTSI